LIVHIPSVVIVDYERLLCLLWRRNFVLRGDRGRHYYFLRIRGRENLKDPDLLFARVFRLRRNGQRLGGKRRCMDLLRMVSVLGLRRRNEDLRMIEWVVSIPIVTVLMFL
jgi:hypothetical protein